MKSENNRSEDKVRASLKRILEQADGSFFSAFMEIMRINDTDREWFDRFFRRDKIPAEKEISNKTRLVSKFVFPGLFETNPDEYIVFWKRITKVGRKPSFVFSTLQKLVSGRVIPVVTDSAGIDGFDAEPLENAAWEEFSSGLVSLVSLVIEESADTSLRENPEDMEFPDDELLGVLGREIRTPLVSALGYNEFIRDGVSGVIPEKTLKAVELSIGNLRRMINLLNDIQEYSRAKRLKKYGLSGVRIFSVEELVDDVIRDLDDHFKKREQFVSVSYEKNGLRVAGIRADLFKVFYNLLENASNYSGRASRIMVNVSYDNEHIFVTVSDNGPGVPDIIRNRLFEPFIRNIMNRYWRDSGSGTGLGLAVTKAILDSHGCEIEYDGGEGKGAIFRFFLPAPGGTGEPVREVRKKEDHRQPRILVVDDDTDALDFTRFILGSEGYDVHAVMSAREGLERVSTTSFDAMLVDVTLIGMDGTEFCRKVKTNPETSGIPVIIVSARSEESVREKARKAGCDEYILKPFKIDNFLSVVKKRVLSYSKSNKNSG